MIQCVSSPTVCLRSGETGEVAVATDEDARGEARGEGGADADNFPARCRGVL